MTRKNWAKKVSHREITVGVVGLGYVGLPLALTFARRGFATVGLDIDPEKVATLNRGAGYLQHVATDDLAALVTDARFRASVDFSEAAACDALVLCVPTPLGRHREPDMSFIENTARTLGPYLQRGQLVVLESTTYPGTTDGLLRETLETVSGLRAESDFFLAFSPEREDPGNPRYTTEGIPKVVGGLNDEARDRAQALYEAAVSEVVPVSSARVAEMSKLLENIFRSVNIALVNELKVLCHRMDIDIWEVIDAAATKPFGFMPFYPGPGLGGHCIPIDPFYLTWKAREYELNTRFIELAGEINTSMPQYVVQRTAEGLNRQRKSLFGAQVLILGIAYKPDVDDVRESPALRIIEILQAAGAEVRYHDPHVPRTKPMRKHQLQLASVPLTDDELESADVVVVVTHHSAVDYDRVFDRAALVVDTRGVLRHIDPTNPRLVRA